MAKWKKITIAGFSIREDRVCTRFLPAYADVPILESANHGAVSAWTVHAGFRKTRAAEYFVDEAGDPALFNSRKHVIVGSEGCSRFFMLGMAWVLDPVRLRDDLESLRRDILADPYFKGVPSLLPENRKTAVMFHAKDDLPEIRREVFRVLMKHPIQFFAVIRDKLTVVDQVRARNVKESTYRYHQHELYDSMIRQLLIGRLHRDQEYVIHFARRGRSDRTEAIRLAVEAAREKFRQKWGIVSDVPIAARAGYPYDVVCLQASDYMLWAVQRLYERIEERYVSAIWPAIRLIHDVDDTRDAAYGRFYTQQKNQLDEKSVRERSRRI